MVLAVDVEIVSVVKDEYRSLKSNPPNGHYGYAVIFHGSTCYKRVDLEFPATRLFYATNEIATIYTGQWFLSQRLAEGLQAHYDCLSPATKICLGLAIADPGNITLPGHPETIVKVKVPPGSQFNIVVYWVDIPGIGLTSLEIDASDGSDGLDEYPEPRRNDPGDPYDQNPPEDIRDPDNDDRDYLDAPTEEGQVVGQNYSVVVARDFAISPPYAELTYTVVGPVSGIRSVPTVVGETPATEWYLDYGEPVQSVTLATTFDVICSGSPPVCDSNSGGFSILSINETE